MGEAFLHRTGCSQRPLGAPGLCGWERAGDGPARRGEGCRQTPAPHCRTQRCPFLAPIELRRLHTPGPQDRQSPRPQNSRRVRRRLLPAQWPLILQPPTPPPSPSSTVEGLKHSGPQPLCPKDSFRLDDPAKLCVSRHYLPQGLGNATPWRCGHGAGQAAEGEAGSRQTLGPGRQPLPQLCSHRALAARAQGVWRRWCWPQIGFYTSGHRCEASGLQAPGGPHV